MTKGMTWEEPPPPGRSPADWPAIARELRAHPGEWLKVFDEGPVSAVNAIRQGEVQWLTPVRPGRKPVTYAGFEVRTRNNRPGPPKVCTLYLRWMNEGD
jgi:hypothetical protein